MAIKDLLDTAWDVKATTDAVMAVRVALQNLKNVANETKSTISDITGGAKFASVDADLKTEGVACISIVNKLVSDLEAHTEFIDYRPDQV